ncbi:MAG TPA: CBS domain-containing protein [Methylomirabilota bacterium]|nr:CBS domain-containing protein [Methylomirabilota bacterium]
MTKPPALGTTRVRDVMAKTPVTIDPEAPLATALAVMRERTLRHLPVTDERGRLIGIVTDRDIRSALFAPAIAEYLPSDGRLRSFAASIERVRVRDVMTWGAVTIGRDAPIAQAAAVMADARVGSLPVVDGEQLVGIVTERDVLRALADTLPSIKGADPDSYLW